MLTFVEQTQEAVILYFHECVKHCNLSDFSFGRWGDVSLQQKITKHIQGKAEFPIFEKLIEQKTVRFTPASAWEDRTQRS